MFKEQNETICKELKYDKGDLPNSEYEKRDREIEISRIEKYNTEIKKKQQPRQQIQGKKKNQPIWLEKYNQNMNTFKTPYGYHIIQIFF